MTTQKISPSHYNEFNLKFMKGAGLLRGFCLGNAIKYLDRAGKKLGEDEAVDILKAKRYIELYLENKDIEVRTVAESMNHEKSKNSGD